MDNSTGKEIVNVLINIHNRLAEISKFLEVCTAKFARIDATNMREEIKGNTPYINFGNAMLDPENNTSIGYNSMFGLHIRDGITNTLGVINREEDNDN